MSSRTPAFPAPLTLAVLTLEKDTALHRRMDKWGIECEKLDAEGGYERVRFLRAVGRMCRLSPRWVFPLA